MEFKKKKKKRGSTAKPWIGTRSLAPWTNGKQQHAPKLPEPKRSTTLGSPIHNLATNKTAITIPLSPNTVRQRKPTPILT